MNSERCEVLKTIDSINTVNKFRLIIDQLNEDSIQLLFECFYNLPLNCTTKKEKLILKKYKKLFLTVQKRQFTLEAAKKFLVQNFRVLKQVVSVILHSDVCLKFALSLVDDGQGV